MMFATSYLDCFHHFSLHHKNERQYFIRRQFAKKYIDMQYPYLTVCMSFWDIEYEFVKALYK